VMLCSIAVGYQCFKI